MAARKDATGIPPHYGLDHGLDVGSKDFIDTMAGATGSPFLDGNNVVVLNNGDRFYRWFAHNEETNVCTCDEGFAGELTRPSSATSRCAKKSPSKPGSAGRCPSRPPRRSRRSSRTKSDP